MSLIRCPECRNKISNHAPNCPHCGFSFAPENLEKFKQQLEQRRLHNAEINRRSTKVHLIWLIIFSLVIFIGIYFNN